MRYNEGTKLFDTVDKVVRIVFNPDDARLYTSRYLPFACFPQKPQELRSF